MPDESLEATAWMVAWHYRGEQCFIDCDDQMDALRLAWLLEEARDREQVRVIQEPLPPLDAATMAKVKERVARRVKAAALVESMA